MNRDIIQRLRELKPHLLQKFGIEKFALFGSQARGDFTQNSDIDIVVFRMNMKSGFDLLYAKKFLEKELNKKVDIGMYYSIKIYIKKRIDEDIVYV